MRSPSIGKGKVRNTKVMKGKLRIEMENRKKGKEKERKQKNC